MRDEDLEAGQLAVEQSAFEIGISGVSQKAECDTSASYQLALFIRDRDGARRPARKVGQVDGGGLSGNWNVLVLDGMGSRDTCRSIRVGAW